MLNAPRIPFPFDDHESDVSLQRLDVSDARATFSVVRKQVESGSENETTCVVRPPCFPGDSGVKADFADDGGFGCRPATTEGWLDGTGESGGDNFSEGVRTETETRSLPREAGKKGGGDNNQSALEIGSETPPEAQYAGELAQASLPFQNISADAHATDYYGSGEWLTTAPWDQAEGNGTGRSDVKSQLLAEAELCKRSHDATGKEDQDSGLIPHRGLLVSRWSESRPQREAALGEARTAVSAGTSGVMTEAQRSPLLRILLSARITEKQKCQRVRDWISLTQGRLASVSSMVQNVFWFLSLVPFQAALGFFALKQLFLCHPASVIDDFGRSGGAVKRLFSSQWHDGYGADFLLLLLTYKATYDRDTVASRRTGRYETHIVLTLLRKRAQVTLLADIPPSSLRDWLCRIWLDVPSSRPSAPKVMQLALRWINQSTACITDKEPVFHLLLNEMFRLGVPGLGETQLLLHLFYIITDERGRCSRDLEHVPCLIRKDRLSAVIRAVLRHSTYKAPSTILSLWRYLCIYTWGPTTSPAFLNAVVLPQPPNASALALYDLMGAFVDACYSMACLPQHDGAVSRGSLVEGAFRIVAAKAMSPVNALDSLQLLVHMLSVGAYPFSRHNDCFWYLQSLIPFFERLKFLWTSTQSVSSSVTSFLIHVIQLLNHLATGVQKDRTGFKLAKKDAVDSTAWHLTDGLSAEKRNSTTGEPARLACRPVDDRNVTAAAFYDDVCRRAQEMQSYYRGSAEPGVAQGHSEEDSANRNMFFPWLLPLKYLRYALPCKPPLRKDRRLHQPKQRPLSACRRRSDSHEQTLKPLFGTEAAASDQCGKNADSTSVNLDREALECEPTANEKSVANKENQNSASIHCSPKGRNVTDVAVSESRASAALGWPLDVTFASWPTQEALLGNPYGGVTYSHGGADYRHWGPAKESLVALRPSPPVLPNPLRLPFSAAPSGSALSQRKWWYSYPMGVWNPGIDPRIPFTPVYRPTSSPQPAPLVDDLAPGVPALQLRVPSGRHTAAKVMTLGEPQTGLINLGNTCYLNAVLQSLGLCTAFVANLFHFELVEEKGSTGEPSSRRLLQELQVLMGQLLFGTRNPVSPERLVHVLPSFFGVGQQQDASEALRYIFAELGGNTQKLVELIFTGQVIIKTQCTKCGSISQHPERISDFGFPLPTEKEFRQRQRRDPLYRIGVQTLFDDYVQPEYLEGDNAYACEKCSTYVTARRWTEIESPPAHLFIVLHCFSWDPALQHRYKETTPVDIQVSIRVWGLLYSLYCVIVHKGSTAQSGHYFALGRRSEWVPPCHKASSTSEDRWYRFDDRHVTLVQHCIGTDKCWHLSVPDDDSSSSARPYILFYRCVDAPPAPSIVVPTSILKKLKKRRRSSHS